MYNNYFGIFTVHLTHRWRTAEGLTQDTADTEPYEFGYGSVCLCSLFMCVCFAQKRESLCLDVYYVRHRWAVSAVWSISSVNALLEISTTALQRPSPPCNSNITGVIRFCTSLTLCGQVRYISSSLLKLLSNLSCGKGHCPCIYSPGIKIGSVPRHIIRIKWSVLAFCVYLNIFNVF